MTAKKFVKKTFNAVIIVSIAAGIGLAIEKIIDHVDNLNYLFVRVAECEEKQRKREIEEYEARQKDELKKMILSVYHV